MSTTSIKFDVSVFIQRHGQTLALCIGLWFAFAFFETLKTLYFAYNKTLVTQYAVHSLYIFFPWCLFSVICGVLTERTIAYPISSHRFLLPHLILACTIALLHLIVLTSSYWVFLPWLMEERSFGAELLIRAVRYFHLELLAYFAMVSIWRIRLNSEAEAQSTAIAPDPGTRATTRSDTLELSTRTGTISLAVDDIEWLLADGNYIVIHMLERELRVRSTFKALLHKLDKLDFMQTHRCAVVNLAKAQKLEKCRLLLDSGRRVPVSRRRYDELIARLSRL